LSSTAPCPHPNSLPRRARGEILLPRLGEKRGGGLMAGLSRDAPPVENAKHRRDKNQRSSRGTQQTTDDGPPERGVLLAAFAQSKGHGNHADDHGEGGHEHRAKARET